MSRTDNIIIPASIAFNRESKAASGRYGPAVALLIGSAMPKGKGSGVEEDDRLRYLLSK